MKIDTYREGNVVTLRPRGLLAGADVEDLAAQVAKLLNDPVVQVVLDVSGILFVDSAGLELLVNTAERLIQSGQTLRLAGANANLAEVLELTELAPRFRFYPDAAAAVESCA